MNTYTYLLTIELPEGDTDPQSVLADIEAADHTVITVFEVEDELRERPIHKSIGWTGE
jgi:hypothetical protein